MSLPTYAIYYNKNNQQIYKEFVNVGWFISPEIWLDAVNKLPNIPGTIIVELYGVKFPHKWIRQSNDQENLILLFLDREKAYLYKTKILNGTHSFNRIYGQDWYKRSTQTINSTNITNSDVQKILLPIIRQTMPTLIATDIVGVQPMSSVASDLFKIRIKPYRWYRTYIDYIKEKIRHIKLYIKYTIKLVI